MGGAGCPVGMKSRRTDSEENGKYKQVPLASSKAKTGDTGRIPQHNHGHEEPETDSIGDQPKQWLKERARAGLNEGDDTDLRVTEVVLGFKDREKGGKYAHEQVV